MVVTNFMPYADKIIAVRGTTILKGLCLPCHYVGNGCWQTKPADHLEWMELMNFPVWIWVEGFPEEVRAGQDWTPRVIDNCEVWFRKTIRYGAYGLRSEYETPWMTKEVAVKVPIHLPYNRIKLVEAAQKRVERQRKARQHDIP